ncbi:MAG: glycosyltransferase family 4 protein, partial [Vicinamibacterales bacterium]
MRIAVDARELCHRPTGVGRYLGELLTEWAASPEASRHEWVLYAHAAPAVPAPWADRVRVVPGAGGTRWEQWDFARRLAADRPDVLFAPAYTAPLTAPCPVALTVHDVSFYALPDEFRFREGVRRRAVTRWSARRARVVLTDSAFSRQEIVRRLGIPPARIRAVPLGLRLTPPPPQAPPREPVVLYVGSILPRRHVDLLVGAFARGVWPRVPGARLEVVGENRLPRPGDLDRAAREAGGGPAPVAFRSYVDEATLAGLYARASVFAFLSAYEGFGLTPLEAMAAGVPPGVLDTPGARG